MQRHDGLPWLEATCAECGGRPEAAADVLAAVRSLLDTD